MGQIIGRAAKPKRCNLNQLSQIPTPAAGEHILVSSGNSMNADGQGNFDCYIEGDGHTAAAALKIKKIEPGLEKLKSTFERMWNFSNGDIVENALLYLGNTGYTAGVFVTPYIDIESIKTHRWKWYIGTDRSGYSGNIASLRLECFDENKTYFTYYPYNAGDPRTFTLTAADQTRVKYIRITFVMTSDCYLQDLATGDYIWYGYYVGKKALEVVDAKANTNKAEINKTEIVLAKINGFSNGDVVENVLIYHGNTGYTAGLFVTPYIDVTDVKSHQWKWYIGTDRSGYSGNIASLRLECFDENKTYFTGYSYNAGDPRTFTLTSADQTRTKYIRITFVMTDDCYLQDLVTGDYIWYGYYIGKKRIDDAIKVVDAKANTNKAEINKAENILARVNDFSKGDITDNSFYYNGNILSAKGVFLTNFLTINPSHTYVWYQGTDRSGVSGVSVTGLMLAVFDANNTQITQYSYNADPRTIPYFNSSVAKVRVSFVANNDCYLFDKTDNKYIWYGYYTGMDKILDSINNGYPQSYAFYETNLIQSRRPHRDVASATSGKILSLLHFSDIHGQATPLKHILAFKDKYSSYIDDTLFTGDLVNDHFGQTNIFETTDGAEDILMTIGNHDVCLGNSVSPMDYQPYSGVTTLQGYNEFIAPFVSNWGVVQPTDAATLGLNHYYKDYDNIRLIVLDCFAPNDSTYISDQVSWLRDVLSSAKTNSKAVVIAVHQTAAALDYERETGFCSYERTTTAYIDGSFSNAVQSFMDDGGEFVCWLAGHTHCDLFGTLANHPNQTQITITCAYQDQYDDGRIAGTPTADSFNIVSFDTYSKLIKVLRVGNNEDRYLRPKNVLTWDYANKKIVSTF